MDGGMQANDVPIVSSRFPRDITATLPIIGLKIEEGRSVVTCSKNPPRNDPSHPGVITGAAREPSVVGLTARPVPVPRAKAVAPATDLMREAQLSMQRWGSNTCGSPRGRCP